MYNWCLMLRNTNLFGLSEAIGVSKQNIYLMNRILTRVCTKDKRGTKGNIIPDIKRVYCLV